MKTIKILSLILTLVVGVTITSCVEDDDYSVPNELGTEENAKLNTLLSEIESGVVTLLTIDEVKTLYQDNFPEVIETNIAVKGYVSSSDRTGNFFKEIYFQDAPENPTSGIKLILNQVDSYNQYNFGREIYIRLTGLYIGEERVGNQVITIGGGTVTNQFGTTVTRLTENQRKNKMFRSENTFEMIPKIQTFTQITLADIGQFVQFNNVEFANNLNGLRYFDPFQDFDTQRILQNCGGFNYSNFILETSSFASFANEYLPVGNGSISGVITKDFTGSVLLMALNSTDDVNLEGDRCSLLNPENFSPLFQETFESYANNAFVTTPWTNYAESGTFRWKVKTSNDTGNPGSKVAWMGAYNSMTLSNIAWMISPAIDLDAQDLEFVNFSTSNDFADNSQLEVLISTNWDGNTANIGTATWSVLTENIVSNSESYQNWVDSGLIDLSSYSGTAYIAFKYIGGDNSGSANPNTGTIDGNFEVDNFKVLVQN